MAAVPAGAGGRQEGTGNGRTGINAAMTREKVKGAECWVQT